MLRGRCQSLQFDSARVVETCRDFPELDVVRVAERCADWISTHTRTRDGPGTLRTFLERAEEELKLDSLRALREAELAPYDQRRNQWR